MLKHSAIILLILYCYSYNAVAQKEDRNWVFGDSICIDFNNLASPQVLSKTAVNYEANASYSYPNGVLRCHYASPVNSDYYWGKIYNDQNMVMQNGDSLNQFNTATNGALFLPFPGDSQKLYFFHIGNSLTIHSNYLDYSIIDFNYNSGHGKVISKNNFLEDSTTEHLLAIRHANGRDWWIITKKIKSNKFVKFLITPNGISNEIVQSIGSVSYSAEGEGSVSKQGDKLAFISFLGNEDVFDFDRCTGDFSNWIELGTGGPYNQLDPQGWLHYGCEFSPDGNRLYVSHHKDSFPYHENIIQFTLSDINPINTKTDILPDRTGFILGQLQLGPNGKIYSLGFAGPAILDSSYKYLSVINNPNDSGLACNLDLFSFYLGEQYNFGGLPNMPNYNLGPIDGSACDTLGIDNPNGIKNSEHSSINIFPNPFTNEFQLSVTGAETNATVTVYNMLGQQVYSSTQKPTNYFINESISLSNFASGIYIITVKVNGEIFNRKIVKQ